MSFLEELPSYNKGKKKTQDNSFVSSLPSYKTKKKPSQNVGASSIVKPVVKPITPVMPIQKKESFLDKANNVVGGIGKWFGDVGNFVLDSKGGQFNPATGYTENKETNRELLSNGIKNIGNLELPNPNKREVYNIKTGKTETIHNESNKVKDYVKGAYENLLVKPSEATKGGLMSIKKAENPLTGIVEGWTGKRQTPFNELMPEGYQEASKKYPALMAIPNLLGEIATSPDTYIGGGFLKDIAKKIKTGKALTKEEQAIVKANPDFFVNPKGEVTQELKKIPLALPPGKGANITPKTLQGNFTIKPQFAGEYKPLTDSEIINTLKGTFNPDKNELLSKARESLGLNKPISQQVSELKGKLPISNNSLINKVRNSTGLYEDAGTQMKNLLDGNKVIAPVQGANFISKTLEPIYKKELPIANIQKAKDLFNRQQTVFNASVNRDVPFTVVKGEMGSNIVKPDLQLPKQIKTLNTALPEVAPTAENVIPETNKTVLPSGQMESGFSRTIIDDAKTTPKLKQGLEDLNLGYDPITNKQTLDSANRRIADNLEGSVQFVKESKDLTAEHTATAIQLINKFQKEGNFERAIDIVQDITPKLTKAGQAIQAASIYGRLSPNGVLVYAQRHINKLNNDRWFKGLTKEYKLSNETAQNLKELAENMQKLTGDAKIEASQELQSALQALGKSGIDRKIESAQTIAQLLNPKTIVRNTVGNELFYRLERINKYVATPIDWLKSTLTGSQRTVTFKTAGQGGYWEGFFKGAKAGWKGVNPSGLQTQYDLTAPAFTGKWNPLTYMEKALGATLKGFDYAAYNRAVKQTIGEMAELRAINEGLTGTARKQSVQRYMTESNINLLDIADQYGKYVTFQDNNVFSKGLSAVKRGLNAGKEFGVGSLIVKYPRTPGALVMRGIEYSPAGFLKSAYELAKPILKGNPINSREVTLSLSRAITGTLGFTGLGYFLADKGVITGQADSDKDIRELERQTGTGSFKVNGSALLRWVTNGFNPTVLEIQEGDQLFSYDWAQPIAMAISFGANINQNIKEGNKLGENAPSVAASSLEGALNTIAEQPVLQGITRQFQGYDLGKNVVNTLKSIPSSFVPTLSNQIKQYSDNTGRLTYDPDPVRESLNMAQMKIPRLSGKLPTAYDTQGKPKEVYQDGSNNLFNVFLNPAFSTKYLPDNIEKEVIRLNKDSGLSEHIPPVVDKYIAKTKTHPKIILTAQEYSDFQKRVGELVINGDNKILKGYGNDGFKKVMARPDYKNASDEDKVEMLKKVVDYARKIARNEILQKRGFKVKNKGV